MKRVKRAATLLMSMSMALTLFAAPVTVSAHEQEAEAGTEVTVITRAAMCPNCGGTMNDISTSWGEWYRTGVVRNCNTYAWGTDLELRREGTKTTKCSTCGFGKSEAVSETRWECHGFNS
ncbi:MAG: hypothetical protein J6B43_12730 [Lachnospiraceae bacterium]|nr:hypothetical protein [Lachnospiraceae bacterium]